METWALTFLGIFFIRIISSFENKVQHEVHLLNTEKIIEQLIIDHEVTNEGLNIVYIISQNQLVSINEIKVFTKTGTCYLTYHFPDIQKFEDKKIRLFYIPKKLFEALQIDNNLNLDIIFKLYVGRDQYYMFVRINFKKIDHKKLQILNKPLLQALTEKEYHLLFDDG